MVALDPVFVRANLTPQENAGFRANSAIFISFFPLFILDTIQGRDWKVGLDDNTGFTCKYLSYGKLCRCFHRLRGGGWTGYSPHQRSLRLFLFLFIN